MKDNKFFISNIGIGDLIIFCSNVLLRVPKNKQIIIKFDSQTFLKYKNDKYKKICFDILYYLLSDYSIIISDEDSENFNLWYPDAKIYQQLSDNEFLEKHFNQKFNKQTIEGYSDSIVVVTKVRDLSRSSFNSISTGFFKKLNNSKSKIILIGERNVYLNQEYERLGDQNVYSIYDDLIKNIDNEKIIDLTKEDYNSDNSNFCDFLEKTNIIYNSKSTIVFGGGGFFCASFFFSNFISLTIETRAKEFNRNKKRKIFYKPDIFLKSLDHL